MSELEVFWWAQSAERAVPAILAVALLIAAWRRYQHHEPHTEHGLVLASGLTLIGLGLTGTAATRALGLLDANAALGFFLSGAYVFIVIYAFLRYGR